MAAPKTADVGIIIALREEFREFYELVMTEPEAEFDPDTRVTYYTFLWPVGGERPPYRCVAVLIGEMGPAEAQRLTDCLISRYDPATLVMLGIAAGLHDDVALGDVVVAEHVDSYLQAGKVRDAGEGLDLALEFSGPVHRCDEDLTARAKQFEFTHSPAYRSWQSRCSTDARGILPEFARGDLMSQSLLRSAPMMHVAYVASGPVVAAGSNIVRMLRGRERRLKALDMESAGLMEAALARREGRRTFVLRGISDFGDERKHLLDRTGNGAFRRVAMRNATAFLWELLGTEFFPQADRPLDPLQTTSAPDSAHTALAARGLDNFFHRTPGKFVQPTELLGLRGKEEHGFRHDFYRERSEVDTRIARSIQRQQSVLVTGKPLAGKSRAIFHQMTVYHPEAVVHIARPDVPFDSENSHGDPPGEVAGSPTFYVFNDIDEFVDLPGFPGLVRRLLRQAARSGGGLVPDDTIGSYFFPIKQMESRYRKLVDDPGKRKEAELLRSYKCVELWRRRNRGNKAIIVDYARMRLRHYYGEPTDVAPYEWARAVRALCDLGFVSDLGEKIQIEPAYVSRIIAAGENQQQIAYEICTYYPDASTYARLIARVTTPGLHQRLFDWMVKQGIEPNDYTFASLLYRADGFAEAWSIYQEVTRSGWRFDIVAFNRLIGKAESFAEASQAREEMVRAGVPADGITLNRLIGKTESFDQAWAVYKQMRDLGQGLSLSTCHMLLRRARGGSEAWTLYREMRSVGMPTGEQFLNSLIMKLESFDEAWGAYLDLREQGGTLIPMAFKQLLGHVKNFARARTVYDQLRREGASTHSTVFNELLKKAASYADAKEVFRRMQEEEVRPSQASYNLLLHKARHYPEAWSVYGQMQEAGFAGDKVTFCELLDLAPNFDAAWYAYERLRALGCTLTRKQLKRLLSMVEAFEPAWELHQQLRAEGEKTTTAVLHELLKKASDFDQARQVFRYMQTEGLRPDAFTFGLLMQKTVSFEEAWSVYLPLSESGIAVDPAIVGMLASRTRNFEHGWELYQQLRASTPGGLSPIMAKAFLNDTVSKAEDYEQARRACEEIRRVGLPPVRSALKILFEMAPDFTVAKRILAQMKDAGFKPKRAMLETLMRKASSFAEAREVHELMVDVGLEHTEETLQLLRARSKTSSEVIQALQIIQQARQKKCG